MKRIISLMVAMLLIAALCVPVFAAPDTNGKITIDNAMNGETYSIYRMADLYSWSGKSYSYKITDGWEDFFSTAPANQWFEVNANGYLVKKEGEISADDMADLAKAALKFAQENEISSNGSQTASGGEVVFDNLILGWYLVDSSAGVICSLNTTDNEVTIKEKNKKPTIDKQVQEDSSGSWGKINSAAMHQKTNFMITVDIADGSNNYKVVDTMTNMVLEDKNNDGKVDASDFTLMRQYTTSGEQSASIEVPKEAYTITIDELKHDDETGKDTQKFTIEFKNAYIENLGTGNHITIAYAASLTDNAVIDGEGNPNDVYMKYGNSSETAKAQTKTYTYAFDMVKTDGSGKLLDGAAFELYIRTKKDEDGYDYTKVEVVKDGENSYHVKGAGEEAADVIEVKGGGKTNIRGLDLNTVYALKEIKAPQGYNILAGYAQITLETGSNLITADLTNGYDKSYGGLEVINKTGAELPETGGMGTTMFILIGSLLVLCSGVLLATKLRMSKMRG